jgi:hypothetical protein
LKDLRAAAEKLERNPVLDAVAMQARSTLSGAHAMPGRSALSSADVDGTTTWADPVAAVMRPRLDVRLLLGLNGRAAIDRATPNADPVADPLRCRLCGADGVMDFRSVNRRFSWRSGSYDYAESDIN